MGGKRSTKRGEGGKQAADFSFSSTLPPMLELMARKNGVIKWILITEEQQEFFYKAGVETEHRPNLGSL